MATDKLIRELEADLKHLRRKAVKLIDKTILVQNSISLTKSRLRLAKLKQR